MSFGAGPPSRSDDAQKRGERAFRQTFRRMMALMSVTIFVAALAAGIAGEEVGIVVVLLCLWVLLMISAVVGERWFLRRLKPKASTAADMSVYILFVVVGVATIFWVRWLLPRQLLNVRTKLPVYRQQRFDLFLQHRSVRGLLVACVVCGSLMAVVGAVSLLMQ